MQQPRSRLEEPARYYSFVTGLPALMGDLLIVAGDDALCAVRFAGEGMGAADGLVGFDVATRADVSGWQRRDDHPLLLQTAQQLRQYFAGTRREFALPLAPAGTPFQRVVWDALLRVPYGQTASYGDMARTIGRPTAFRAVGLANGQNPIAIIVPCHRVIGSSGGLTGYGGGLPRKVLLLELERRHAPQTRAQAGGELSLF